MSEPLVLVADDAGIRRITVNRPDKLNALNAATLDALQAAFDDAVTDDGVRVVILTGAGPKAFVAGADIAEMAELRATEGRDFSLRGQKLMRSIERLPKPVIAMVHGYALGGGSELALAADLVIASEDACLGTPGPRLWGAYLTGRWIYRLGLTKAKEYGMIDEILSKQTN